MLAVELLVVNSLQHSFKYTVRLKIFIIKYWKKLFMGILPIILYPTWFIECFVVFSHVITIFENAVSSGGTLCH